MTDKQKMPKYSFDDLKAMILELGSKIDVPWHLYPTCGSPRGDATPHIEIDNDGYIYIVISERGTEFSRKKFDNIDDFLYHIFASATFSMACSYELKHRVEGKDCRRIMFPKQEELLGKLNKVWRERMHATNQSFIKSATFDDLASLRATYCGSLRKQGYSETEINKMAYEKYPES